MFFKIFFVLSFLFISINCEPEKKEPPKQLSIDNCVPGFPYQSVGDFIMTDSNYTKLIKSHKFLIVIGSAGWCRSCCIHEAFYSNLINFYLKDKNKNPYANETKVARIDFANPSSGDIDTKFGIVRVPYIIIFKNAKPYLYRDLLDYSRIIRFINRIHRPMLRVSTLEKLEIFVNRTEIDYENQPINTIKVIGFFFDEEETLEDREEFENAANLLIERNEVYFAMMTNQKEIKKAKQKYKELWFDDYTLTSVVIQHFPGKFQIIDISDLVLSLKKLSTTIQSNVLNLVGEYKYETHQIFEEKKKPVLVFVIDTFVNIEASKKLLRIAEEVAKLFFEKVYFSWVDGNLNIERKIMLGIEHQKLPTMAFMRIDYENKISYPVDWPINYETIKQFVQDYLELPLMEMLLKYDDNTKKLKKSSLYSFLTDSCELNSTSVIEEKNKNNDLVIWFFHSRRDVDLINNALIYNHISKRFKSFGYNEMKTCYYDFYYNSPPKFLRTDIIDPTQPFLIFFPAFTHPDLYDIFSGEFKADKIMEFISNLAGARISLPEYPHIPEEFLDEYLSEISENPDNINEEKYYKRIKEEL